MRSLELRVRSLELRAPACEIRHAENCPGMVRVCSDVAVCPPGAFVQAGDLITSLRKSIAYPVDALLCTSSLWYELGEYFYGFKHVVQ